MNDDSIIEFIESYYRAIDRFDTDAIVAHFSPDAVMEIATGNVRHAGIDAIRLTYDRRATEIQRSFHGHFTHVIDADGQRAVTRLAVHRTSTEGEYAELDCIALFTFDDGLIANLVIWMSGENTLK